MAGSSRKAKDRRQAVPVDAPQAGPSRGRRIATIIISLILVIGLGLPVAGLGFASCSASNPIYSD